MPAPEYKTTHPKNRQQWRQWLEKNHIKNLCCKGSNCKFFLIARQVRIEK